MLRKILKFNGIFIVLLLIGFASLESCKKYEDGPRFSLKSKGKRLVGTWKAVYQDQDGTEFLNDFTVMLNQLASTKHPEGSFETHTKFTSSGSNHEVIYYGTWELSDDKEDIIMYHNRENYFDGQSWTGYTNILTSYWMIKRLTMKELWIEEVQNSTVYNIKFKKE